MVPYKFVLYMHWQMDLCIDLVRGANEMLGCRFPRASPPRLDVM